MLSTQVFIPYIFVCLKEPRQISISFCLSVWLCLSWQPSELKRLKFFPSCSLTELFWAPDIKYYYREEINVFKIIFLAICYEQNLKGWKNTHFISYIVHSTSFNNHICKFTFILTFKARKCLYKKVPTLYKVKGKTIVTIILDFKLGTRSALLYSRC